MLAVLVFIAYQIGWGETVPAIFHYSDNVTIQSPDSVVVKLFQDYIVDDNCLDSLSMDSADNWDPITQGLVDSFSTGLTNALYVLLFRIHEGTRQWFASEEYDARLDTTIGGDERDVAIAAIRDTQQYLITATGFSTLTTADNIGVNFNDIDGELDVSEIAAAVYEEIWRNIDTTNIDTSLLGQWITKCVWNAATRYLTEIDEDNTTIDLNATTFGTATNVTNGVTVTTNNDKANYTLATSALDAIWEYAIADITSPSGIGTYLMDTAAYQGAASGLTVDQIWEYDTTNINDPAAIGSMLKDTSAYQGAAAGLTAADIWAYATRTLTEGIGDTALSGDEIVAALTAVRDSLQYLVTSVGDTAVSGDEIVAAITSVRDSLQYLITATGFSTHSAADVWAAVARTLTELDEDNTTIDLDGTTVNATATVDTAAIARSVWNDNIVALALRTVNQTEILDSLAQILDTLQNYDNWIATAAYMDSLLWLENYMTGVTSRTTYANDSDNVLILKGVDTLGSITYYHVGDTAGYPPDSTKYFPVDSLR